MWLIYLIIVLLALNVFGWLLSLLPRLDDMHSARQTLRELHLFPASLMMTSDGKLISVVVHEDDGGTKTYPYKIGPLAWPRGNKVLSAAKIHVRARLRRWAIIWLLLPLPILIAISAMIISREPRGETTYVVVASMWLFVGLSQLVRKVYFRPTLAGLIGRD